jgi:hypothetical protein
MSGAGRPSEVQQDPDSVDAAIAVLQGEATAYAHAKRLTGNLWRNHPKLERVERRIQREKGRLLQRREQEVEHWLTPHLQRLGIHTMRDVLLGFCRSLMQAGWSADEALTWATQRRQGEVWGWRRVDAKEAQRYDQRGRPLAWRSRRWLEPSLCELLDVDADSLAAVLTEGT